MEYARELASQKYDEIIKNFNEGIKPPPVIEKEKLTFAQVCHRYIDEYSKLYKKPNTTDADERSIENRLIPELGYMLADEIKSQHIAEFHAKYNDIPYAANRALAIISHIFNWAMQMELIEQRLNPCQYIRKYKEERRERYLSNDEMKRLSKAIHIIEVAKVTLPVVTKAIKLLIFTGCRRNEILTLTWAEVDFEHKVLKLKDSKTGKKLVPISDIAMEIIKTIPRLPNNPYVISNKEGTGHITCIKKTWEHIRQLAELPDLRLHDLRHNFASVGVCDNMSLAVIGKLLGHSQTATTERYAHLQSDPLRQAANQISIQIDNIFKSKNKSKSKVNKPV